MTKITTMDKASVRLLHEAINKALSDVALEYGVTARMPRVTYDATGFGGRVEVKLLVAPGDGTPLTGPGSGITALAKRMADMHGLDPNKPNGKGWVLVDYNDRATRMPWIVQAYGGKRYKITQGQANAYFKRAIPAPGTRPEGFVAPSIPATGFEAPAKAAVNAGKYDSQF